MYNSIDTVVDIHTIAQMCSRRGGMFLNEVVTKKYIPNLDRAVRKRDGALPHNFYVTQNGYRISEVRVVSYSGVAYVLNVHYMKKQYRRRKTRAPKQYSSGSA